MAIEPVQAYRTSDGQLWQDEATARLHEVTDGFAQIAKANPEEIKRAVRLANENEIASELESAILSTAEYFTFARQAFIAKNLTPETVVEAPSASVSELEKHAEPNIYA